MAVGLTQEQAQERLAQVGENRLTGQKQQGALGIFLSQFKDLLILILAGATLVSAFLGQTAEAVAILAIVLINALLGFVQEYRTQRTLAALKELSAPTARVVRSGRPAVIPAAGLVPGDYVLVEAGDRVPGDMTLARGEGLWAEESMLTGESAPVHKVPGDTLYMGTVVTLGHGEGTVGATGMNTEMGGIAGLLAGAQEGPTPLEKKLAGLGVFLAGACLAVCLAVSVLGVLAGQPVLDMVLLGVSLSVAAIPEGLPAVVTVVLALSVNRMVEKGAVVRRLHAVETLGCAGVICTDKTGTLTQNKMTVRALWCAGQSYAFTGDGYTAAGALTLNGSALRPGPDTPPGRALLCAALCATARVEREGASYVVTGDPTEAALLIASKKGGISTAGWTKTGEQPFDARRRLMSVTARRGTESRTFCKGATGAVLACCTTLLEKDGPRPLSSLDRRKIEQAEADLAGQALRVLALAEGDGPGEGGLTFLGLAAMLDPPRPEAAAAVKACRRAGIRPVMITGDAAHTAAAIARRVGIGGSAPAVVTGADIEALDDGALQRLAPKTDVFARVSPAHKLRIVRALRGAGQVTVMTGDGVNDAPALKEADIGVAMGRSGTDVAREAAEMVVLDDNFATIVAAVEEGRVIYRNIRRFLRYLLTSNLAEVLIMVFCLALGLPPALLPIQILIMNLLTDGLPAVALGMEPPGEGLMERPPRPRSEGLFSGGLWAVILWRGVLLGACATAGYASLLWGGIPLNQARSAALFTMVLGQLLHLFECRGSAPLGKNPWLLAAAGGSALLLTACVTCPPLMALAGTEVLSSRALRTAVGAAAAGPVAARCLRLARRGVAAVAGKKLLPQADY